MFFRIHGNAHFEAISFFQKEIKMKEGNYANKLFITRRKIVDFLSFENGIYSSKFLRFDISIPFNNDLDYSTGIKNSFKYKLIPFMMQIM